MTIETEFDDGLCQGCHKNPATDDLHSCPYAEEINDDDSDDHCSCCDECAHECAMDI